tara:strand:- start:51931 stop:52347 length:417 start_codon:yes stop_codon:yes gene_type:complete
MEEKGLRFNTGKLKWSLVSWKALAPMVQVLSYGAHKYTTFKRDDGSTVTGAQISKEDSKGLEIVTSGANNWKGGLKYTEVAESLKRHLFEFVEGEDNDGESGLHHIGHILCNAMFLSYMILFRKDLDDRDIDKNLKNE